jgi:phospholipid/cholesterol/gamma-HCH transport system permease protein
MTALTRRVRRIRGPIELWLLPFFSEIGALALFFGAIVRHLLKPPFEAGELLFQMYQVGVRSVPVVLIAGFFVGGVVVLQFDYALNLFGAEIYLGGITTSGLLREVGPVLVAVMIAGRVGAYITAELATMKVTEQVDAVRCLGVNPVQFLVVPRFLAVTAMIFVLTILGLIFALLGGALVGSLFLNMNLSFYFANIRKLAAAWALFNGMLKSILFGIVVATISCYQGMKTEGGAEAVGRAVNTCLVHCSIAIFLLDYIIASLAALTFGLAEEIIF